MVEPGVDLAVTVSGHPLVGGRHRGPGGAATGMAPRRRTCCRSPTPRPGDSWPACPASRCPTGSERLEVLLLRVGALVEGVPGSPPWAEPGDPPPGGIAIVDAAVQVTPVERNPLPPVRCVGA
jgi:hypothetical protein